MVYAQCLKAWSGCINDLIVTFLSRVLSRVFEGEKLPPPPKKKRKLIIIILISLQYITNYNGKIIQPQRGQCTRSKYSLSKDTQYDKIVSQNAPDCISAHIHFKNISGGALGSSWPSANSPLQIPDRTLDKEVNSVIRWHRGDTCEFLLSNLAADMPKWNR